MDNPYAPPVFPSSGLPTVKLYSPGQVAWASFLGAPIAGCVLLALNYKRFGNFGAANFALAFGLIGTTLMFVVAFFLPDSIPNSTLPVAYTFGMYQYAKSMQGSQYERRLQNGGIKASSWMATFIGIVSIFCILVALCAVVLVAPEEWFSDEL